MKPLTACSRTGEREDRPRDLRRALVLEYLTVGWNVAEGIIAVAAAVASGSVALLGFGIDSFVEVLSGGILIWRLASEKGTMDHEAVERLDRRAHRLVAISLFALAAYVASDSLWTLWHRDHPRPSAVGIVLTSVSIGVMWSLVGAKRKAAAALGSRALEADAFQTTACWWLSVITLLGVGLNALFGWWWADPVAALVMVPIIAREGIEALRGETCCDEGACH